MTTINFMYKPVQATARPEKRQSPALMSKTDSVPSLNNMPFNTSSSSWSSRGPSPLTLGHADTVPLAVAFSENVNAYFKGCDEARSGAARVLLKTKKDFT